MIYYPDDFLYHKHDFIKHRDYVQTEFHHFITEFPAESICSRNIELRYGRRQHRTFPSPSRRIIKRKPEMRLPDR